MDADRHLRPPTSRGTHDRTITVLSAGLSQPSSTRMLADRLADATLRQLEARGLSATVQTFELRDVAHELVNNLLTGFPSGDLQTVVSAVTGADGLIAVSPIFATSYSGLFKLFVDVIDRDALTGMPVLLGATGGTPRHSLALEYAMRPLFTYLRSDVGRTTVFAATDDWSGQGGANPLHDRIQQAGRELAETVAAQTNAGPTDLFARAPTFDQLLGGL